jgi:hypothetical protein
MPLFSGVTKAPHGDRDDNPVFIRRTDGYIPCLYSIAAIATPTINAMTRKPTGATKFTSCLSRGCLAAIEGVWVF